MPQLLKVHIDDSFSKLTGRHLHKFMRRYVWKITTSMIFFVPFSLNARYSIYDPYAKFSNRVQNFAVCIMIQSIKCMSCIVRTGRQGLGQEQEAASWLREPAGQAYGTGFCIRGYQVQGRYKVLS